MFVSKREGCSKQTILSGQICFYSLVLYESKEGYTPNIVYDEASAVYVILTCALVAGDAEWGLILITKWWIKFLADWKKLSKRISISLVSGLPKKMICIHLQKHEYSINHIYNFNVCQYILIWAQFRSKIFLYGYNLRFKSDQPLLQTFTHSLIWSFQQHCEVGVINVVLEVGLREAKWLDFQKSCAQQMSWAIRMCVSASVSHLLLFGNFCLNSWYTFGLSLILSWCLSATKSRNVC